ncbi:hypothetical protein JL720_2661 [Aureococcus anophagefferens]|nr:hypothetical protein JL720_2661 [Aureococcus anophagefferens]
MNNIHEAVSEAAYVANRHADRTCRPGLPPGGRARRVPRERDAVRFLGVHPIDEGAHAVGDGRAPPTCALPDEVTEDGWYAPPTPGSGKETDDECRDRALGVAADVRARAAALDRDLNVVAVVHYDFICAFLDALVAPATRGPFLRWRQFNTGITVVDVDGATGAASFVAQNAVAHLLDERDPALLSGFPL